MEIKLVVFDFDGVFTDGKNFLHEPLKIKKYYDIKDGMGLKLLKDKQIKIALISSYKSVLKIEYNNEYNLNEHLKFDFFSVGTKNKKQILQEWIEELNIKYENIAFIGDDLNDIELLSNVGFSACPNNAVKECKECVDYICGNNGGKGCVREFCELIVNNNKIFRYPKVIKKIYSELNYNINKLNLNKVGQLADLIKNHKHNIYITGIGKSKNMAIHMSEVLKSVSINSFYLDATSALHGDIGPLDKNDILILFSKSGNTKELMCLMPFLKKREVHTIGITCDEKSKFDNFCDQVINLPMRNELCNTIQSIPTNSCMVQLIFINILIAYISEEFDINKYKNNHPAGTIGKSLKTVGDCLSKEFPLIKIVKNENISLMNVLLEMTKYSIGCCVFVDENNKIIGILLDGDIRRLHLKDITKSTITIEDLNKNYVKETDKNKFIYELEKKHKFIPFVENDIIKGLIDLEKV